MGYDKSPSQDKTIFFMGILVVTTLVAITPMLRSYFFSVVTPLERRRIEETGHGKLDAYHAEQARLVGNVEDSIVTLGRGRVASPSIAPRQPSDVASQTGAVEGWAQLKDEAGAHAAEVAFNRAEQARLAREQALVVDGGVPVEPTPAVPAAPEAPVPGVTP